MRPFLIVILLLAVLAAPASSSQPRVNSTPFFCEITTADGNTYGSQGWFQSYRQAADDCGKRAIAIQGDAISGEGRFPYILTVSRSAD